jgi:pimeloyl-ACP methyl ester carboxylesterase
VVIDRPDAAPGATPTRGCPRPLTDAAADERGADPAATMPGRLVSTPGGTRLFVRRHVSTGATGAQRPPVLYVHGATFPSGLSVGYPLGGRSWADELAAAGLDVWAFDFRGFGRSDRYPQQDADPGGTGPLGRAVGPGGAGEQLLAVLEHVVTVRGGGRVSLLAHSWGTLVAGLAAAARPDVVDRLALFGPITRREPGRRTGPHGLGGWYPLTAREQHDRFVGDVPAGLSPVLTREFDRWARDWLATDPTAAARRPASVRVPAGPSADIAAAWSGHLPYDPAGVQAPTLVVRGAWDSRTTDADAAWLLGALTRAPLRRHVKIRRGTHLLHLEAGRHALHRETAAFLLGHTDPPAAPST